MSRLCSSTGRWHPLTTLADFIFKAPPVARGHRSASPERRSAPCCVVTMSLVLSGGCPAVLYEALDDSPDDMYLDWFQGQLCPPPRVLGLSAPCKPLSCPVSLLDSVVSYLSLAFFSATLEFSLDRPDSEGGVLQRVAKLFVYKNLKGGWGEGSSYGLGPMLAGVNPLT